MHIVLLDVGYCNCRIIDGGMFESAKLISQSPSSPKLFCFVPEFVKNATGNVNQGILRY